MELEEGKRLLLKRSGIARDEANDAIAEAIVTELGSLALAITQAGVYICVHECNLESYLDMYRVYYGELLEQYRHITQRLDNYQRTVFTTWKASLRKLSPQAIDLFYLFAFMHYDQILEETFRRASLNIGRVTLTDEYASAESTVTKFLSTFKSDGSWYRLAFLNLITEIRSYSLIDFDPAHGTFSILPLVHSWIRTVVNNSYETEKRTTILLALSINRAFEAHDLEYRVKLVPHVAALATNYMSDPSLTRKFAMILGSCHPNTLTDMLEFSIACHKNGELRGVEKLHITVLEGRIQALGDTHPDTCRAKGYLATTYRERGRFKEAVQLHLEAFEGAKTHLGLEARETLLTQHSLTATYKSRGLFQDAESLLTETLVTQKRVLGRNHPDTLNTMRLLADVLQLTSGLEDRLKDAEDLATQALEIRKQISGSDHSRTLSCYAVVARIRFKQGQFESALKIQEEIVAIQSRTLGELHLQTRTFRKDLALIYQSLGRLAEAEEAYQQVVETGIQLLGQEHPDVLSSVIDLATVCASLGKWTESEDIISKELSILANDDKSSMVTLKISLAGL
ncbi:hypothetical protein B0J17DRAFT_716878 [Rhizoctonia solani]|nr:hypothetical protein B0J17DRAFT_716878 [Rhizoctonia solani]